MPDRHDRGATGSGSPIRPSSDALHPTYGCELIVECRQEAGLDFLPNDLTRLLYLASLRDCNSGHYLHPTLSQRLGIEMADEGLRACHLEIFWRLLAIPPSGYVSQLEEYIRYTRTEKAAVLHTWQSLEAYRATIPVLATQLYRDLFCCNVEAALLVLKRQSSTAQDLL